MSANVVAAPFRASSESARRTAGHPGAERCGEQEKSGQGRAIGYGVCAAGKWGTAPASEWAASDPRASFRRKLVPDDAPCPGCAARVMLSWLADGGEP